MTLRKTCILAAVGLLLFYGFLAVWPVSGADVTKTFRMYFPVDPAKVTVGTSQNFSFAVAAVMTPYVSGSAPYYVDRTVTIDDSSFVYLYWAIHWYDAADPPTTVIQPYCGQNRLKIAADSTIITLPFAFGGAIADTAIVAGYRNNASTPYEADTCVNCDSMRAQLYVLDTATTTITFRALFNDDQWVSDPDLIVCPAVSQLADTITDTIAADTVTIVASGCIEETEGNVVCTLYAYDSANATFIEGAKVSCYNGAGQWVGGDQTDGDGKVVASLITGNSYELRYYNPLYNWAIDTITASDALVDSALTYRLPAYSSEYVWIYLTGVTNIIDSTTGVAVPTNARWTIELVGEPVLNDGSFAVLPEASSKYPDANGTVQWIVPANTMLNPPGSYYALTAQYVRDRSLRRTLVKNFYIDTSSTPINIINATEVP